MNDLGFRYTYVYMPCKFKRNLPALIFESEKEVREDSLEDFIDPAIEVVSFEKIGFREYLLIWKTTGRPKVGE